MTWILFHKCQQLGIMKLSDNHHCHLGPRIIMMMDKHIGCILHSVTLVLPLCFCWTLTAERSASGCRAFPRTLPSKNLVPYLLLQLFHWFSNSWLTYVSKGPHSHGYLWNAWWDTGCKTTAQGFYSRHSSQWTVQMELPGVCNMIKSRGFCLILPRQNNGKTYAHINTIKLKTNKKETTT